MERYALAITEAAEPRPAEESWQLQYRRVDEVKSGRGNDAPGESLIPPLTVENCCIAEIFRPVPVADLSDFSKRRVPITRSPRRLVQGQMSGSPARSPLPF